LKIKPVTGNITGYRLTGNRLTTLMASKQIDIIAETKHWLVERAGSFSELYVQSIYTFFHPISTQLNSDHEVQASCCDRLLTAQVENRKKT